MHSFIFDKLRPNIKEVIHHNHTYDTESKSDRKDLDNQDKTTEEVICLNIVYFNEVQVKTLFLQKHQADEAVPASRGAVSSQAFVVYIVIPSGVHQQWSNRCMHISLPFIHWSYLHIQTHIHTYYTHFISMSYSNHIMSYHQ